MDEWLREQSTLLSWLVAGVAFVIPCIIAAYILYSIYSTNILVSILSFYIFPVILILCGLVARVTWEKTIIIQNRQRATEERERLVAHYGATRTDPTLQPGDIRGDDLGAR
jgi:hypothetical protein